MATFVAQEMPLGRFGRAEDVGDVVAFLSSERASLVTGACIPGRRLPESLSDLER